MEYLTLHGLEIEISPVVSFEEDRDSQGLNDDRGALGVKPKKRKSRYEWISLVGLVMTLRIAIAYRLRS
jgi:hypothetical protein